MRQVAERPHQVTVLHSSDAALATGATPVGPLLGVADLLEGVAVDDQRDSASTRLAKNYPRCRVLRQAHHRRTGAAWTTARLDR